MRKGRALALVTAAVLLTQMLPAVPVDAADPNGALPSMQPDIQAGEYFAV